MFAFKEWTLICDALGRGDQSLIIRKGGIAEGRDGFRFQHADFLLFPTHFHEQLGRLRLPPGSTLPTASEAGTHIVTLAAHVEWTHDINDWEKVRALDRFHLWTEAELEKRFRRDEHLGVSVTFVRIARLSEPLLFPDAPKYGGCRSWIEVPALPPATHLTPVLDEPTHRERDRQIRVSLGG